ncbi:hypothetical protein [Blastococcus sp. LR1]|uniref:hypothetical protein n=1 Tax=Blastococcus sp. LR1 TaxID=2877000 RepID=UPI001CCB4843|nr:hypothetical protein [Blastococcus sp. LR1]MCA0144322.1 hypothetical protein [Blastococcus sp. LR1]
MSRLQEVLVAAPVESDSARLPDLLASNCWRGPGGTWWAGVLSSTRVRVVDAPAGRLTLTGPLPAVQDPQYRYRFHFNGRLTVDGTVDGVPVRGVVDRPGLEGWWKNVTGFSRERKRARVVLEDGRTWWLRATGPSAVTVTTTEGRVVARRGAQRGVHLDTAAGNVDQLVALLLLTSIDREDLLAIGSL